MIIVAKNAGFCFGVRRATDIVEELIKNKGDNDIVCTLGKLIHNEQYSEYLTRNNVVELDAKQIDKYYEKATQGTAVTIVIRTV